MRRHRRRQERRLEKLRRRYDAKSCSQRYRRAGETLQHINAGTARQDTLDLERIRPGIELHCECHAGTARGNAEVDCKPDAQSALHEDGAEFLVANRDLYDAGAGERRYDPAEGTLLAAQTGDETDIEGRQRNVETHVDRDIGDLSGAERQRRQRKGIAHREMTLQEADLETGVLPGRKCATCWILVKIDCSAPRMPS